MTLEIKNLNVFAEGKKILEDINLNLETGKIYVLLGPNGSGKSTLSNTITGNPRLKKTGEIRFNEESIIKSKPNEISKKGIFMSFQNPVEIPGVSISGLLRNAYNSIHREKISILDFQKLLEKTAEKLNLPKEFLERTLEGFSGGEKKKLEILQLLVLNPKLAIFDETDSGLDFDSIKAVSKSISEFMCENKILLVITHHAKILEYLKPDRVFVMKSGKIVDEGSADLIKKTWEKGYGA